MATPSLAMIPSAYADSKVYSVLPNNGDGDFTFNRDSSATRVGQNGLIQTVGYFGSELVTNGSFDTDSDWTFSGGGVSISGGKLNFVNTTREAEQSISIVNGKTYRVEYKVSNYSTGTVRVELGTALGTARNTNGIYVEEIISAGSSIVQIDALTIFTGSIDYISIKEVTGDQPRLNYDISNGVVQSCPSLLLEPSRSNSITNSESFGSTGWSNFVTGTAITTIVTNDYAISPDGTQNAQRIQFNLGGGTTITDRAVIRQSIASQTDWILSVYMKSTNGVEQKILWHVGGDANETVVTGEWKRYTFNRNGVTNSWAGLALRGSVSSVDTADILVYGFQAEQGSYATSYIPTSGSSQTRAAETCNDAGNAATFNDSEGVLYAEISALDNSGDYRLISLSDGTTSNRLFIGFRLNTGYIYYYVIAGGVSQSNFDTTITSANSFSKIALKYKANDFALWVNGVEIYADSSGSIASGLDTLQFADGNVTNRYFYGNCKDIRVYNEALTDAQLQTLTTL